MLEQRFTQRYMKLITRKIATMLECKHKVPAFVKEYFQPVGVRHFFRYTHIDCLESLFLKLLYKIIVINYLHMDHYLASGVAPYVRYELVSISIRQYPLPSLPSMQIV